MGAEVDLVIDFFLNSDSNLHGSGGATPGGKVLARASCDLGLHNVHSDLYVEVFEGFSPQQELPQRELV